MNPFVKCTKFCVDAQRASIFKDIDEFSHTEWCCHEKCEHWVQNLAQHEKEQKEEQK